MKALVWHWGRRGAGPLFAASLAAGINQLAGQSAVLSLAAGAEILATRGAPRCDWKEPTYSNLAGYAWQRLAGPFLAARTARRVAALQPDIAICAMPSLLDRRMVQALRRRGTPYAVVVHDATAHPGERLTFRVLDQSGLLRGACALFALTAHVGADLRRQGFGAQGQSLHNLWHPPFDFGAAPPPMAHGGKPRLLKFGRLLPYKGLDLLAAALELLGPDLPFTMRICGDGPNSGDLERLQKLPGVTVERRWVPEAELPELLAWSDAVVLPYREASQSGVAAAAMAMGRYVLATNVGGLPEQLAGLAGVTLCDPTGRAIADGMVRLFDTPSGPAAVDSAADWRAMADNLMAALARPSG
jgi:glycosyltransferase involved in cell wall biosynthesis